jgi:hypothetical protein
VLIGRLPAARIGDAHACSFPGNPPHPPTMIVNINKSSSSWPIISRYQHFCVNILSHEQQSIADRFAGDGEFHGAAKTASRVSLAHGPSFVGLRIPNLRA